MLLEKSRVQATRDIGKLTSLRSSQLAFSAPFFADYFTFDFRTGTVKSYQHSVCNFELDVDKRRAKLRYWSRVEVAGLECIREHEYHANDFARP